MDNLALQTSAPNWTALSALKLWHQKQQNTQVYQPMWTGETGLRPQQKNEKRKNRGADISTKQYSIMYILAILWL